MTRSNPAAAPGLARRLGLFDVAMLVMGGIVGSGIFMNPSVVARVVHTPFLMLGAWALGGAIALAGAFVYAELAARRPLVGGQYAYLREAYHPMLAFIYGWALLLVVQTGGMAAGAITFARYFRDLTHVPLADGALAVLALGGLTAVNCLGVRAGGTVQNVFMVLKVLAIVALVGVGLVLARAAPPADGGSAGLLDRPVSFDLFTAFGAAMVPGLFAYGGWQTASFVAGEVREPARTLPRGLVLGVLGVGALYLAVNLVCIRAPVVAIALQGVLAAVIAVSGRYEQILNYVVSADWIFFGLSAGSLFALRRRDAGGPPVAGARVPGHPWTTGAFVAVSALVVANTLYRYPANSLIGLAILLAGVPAYFAWRRGRRGHSGSAIR